PLMLKVPRRWINRPAGPLPDFVHAFYNYPLLRTPERTQRVVDELVRRHRALILTHLDRFKAEQKDRQAAKGKKMPDFQPSSAPFLMRMGVSMPENADSDAWLKTAAFAGARKAILAAKDAYEVPMRFTNALHGALVKAVLAKEFRLAGSVRDSEAALRIRRVFNDLVWPQSLERIGTLSRTQVLSELYSPRTPRGRQRKILLRLFHFPKPPKPVSDVAFSSSELRRYSNPEALEEILRQPGLNLRTDSHIYESPTVSSVASKLGVSKQNVSQLARKALAKMSFRVNRRADVARINRFLHEDSKADPNHPGVEAFLRYHAKTLETLYEEWLQRNGKSHPWRVEAIRALDTAVVKDALVNCVKESLFQAQRKARRLGFASGLLISKVESALNALAGVKRGPQLRRSKRAISCWQRAASARRIVTEKYHPLREGGAEQLAFVSGIAPERKALTRRNFNARRRSAPVEPVQGQRVLWAE
ncbi:MAG TPA: hypothetical protein VI874_02960, partial [Candidatus Norongarragalinales archaeon]|nr:hypothetical protein [Candidatus Norongarragalinales archaeon]